jgi:transcription antitermination factor NusG
MMLAPANDENKNLYLEYCKANAENEIRVRDERMGPYRAEVVPGATPSWVAVTVVAAHENIAAAHLSARGFGIYLPEIERTEIRRGRRVDFKRLMLPGYVFVHVWDLDRHTRRIRACPGVLDFMKFGDEIVRLSWRVINEIRVIENLERPISLPMDEVIVPVKKKKRWRKSRVAQTETRQVPNEILCVHAYSPFIEEMRQAGLDDEERLSAFHRRLGLGS